MPPKRKTLPSSSPDVLKKLIPEALAINYQGMVYDEAKPCPECRCEDVTRYDMRGRTFCTTIVDGSFRPIGVGVKRFKCSKCDTVFEGKTPFYDGCNNASPIVDLCFALAASNPYNRVEAILMNYGIQADRDTVKNYAMRFRDRAMDYAGIPVMDDAKIGMNVLKILFDVENAEELRKRYPGKYDALGRDLPEGEGREEGPRGGEAREEGDGGEAAQVPRLVHAGLLVPRQPEVLRIDLLQEFALQRHRRQRAREASQRSRCDNHGWLGMLRCDKEPQVTEL
jgi:rubredoxin